jgi:hypothetical protein
MTAISTTQSLRRAAVSCIVGGAATALAGIAVQGVVQPATTVPHDRWSFPWSSSALVPISVLWASLHVLVFVGVLGFSRSGLAGTSRTGRVGLGLALLGTALLCVGELASIPIRDRHTDDTGAVIVAAIFGAAVVLTAVGFLMAGVATLRAGLWHGWRRFTPLSVGIVGCLLVGVNVTAALPTGVALYGICVLALGIAFYTQPTPELARVETPRVTGQEQAA